MTFEQWKRERGLTLGSEVDALIRDAFDTSRAAALEPEPGCDECSRIHFISGSADVVPQSTTSPCPFHVAARRRALEKADDSI